MSRRVPTIYELKRELHVKAPLKKVFPFFSEANNLEKLTPRHLNFRIRSPLPIAMREGRLIDYQIRLRGIPLLWQTEITVWEPPYRFVDEQKKGPYELWIHEHTFEETERGSMLRDVVRYRPPGGTLIHRLFVKPELERIFDYRTAVMRDLFKEVSP